MYIQMMMAMPFSYPWWTIKNLGPLYIPEKGATVSLDQGGRSIYGPVIKYETGSWPSEEMDSVFFHNELWNEDGRLLGSADRIVLCSDGITGDYGEDLMSERELGFIVSRSRDARNASQNLIAGARKKDDRTAIVFGEFWKRCYNISATLVFFEKRWYYGWI